ncbi:hypothetical protein GCM10018980_10410 [Streptomyces capoamus]|uniref:Uncharacterized protein n=1 Tax=Streptomyces capoamus TaxID=68183 RepID=A0A919EU00_9ACTN|nr:hypothetical protein GCM10018980_10410 [Streptomyces capoamus]
MSRRAPAPYDSARRSRASGSAARPSGTFSQKIQCQETCSVRLPPMSGPEATASPLTAPQMPYTVPRLAAGTAAVSRVSVSGIITAAPTPWTARAAIREPMPGARAAAAEAAVNTASPAMKRRRRPKRSPSAAPNISRTAKVSV